MFHSARITLTAWYLLIIMVISVSFSIVLYRISTWEIDRIVARQQLRLQQQFGNPDFFPQPFGGNRQKMLYIDPDVVTESKEHLIFNLFVINCLIACAAGGFGFMLAGKTLQPIKVMLDEQRRFIADASHELRTPLTAMKTDLEVTLRDTKLSLKEAKEVLENNLADVNNLQRLSNGLLELARYDTQKRTDPSSAIESEQVITAAIATVRPLARHKKITIKKQLSSVKAHIQPEKLQELMLILLDNAIKYSPNDTTIQVSCVKKENAAIISVTDQGAGIPAKDLPHLYDRFYQGESSRTSGERKGYGLGLAIARKIVDDAGGNIHVQSQPGQGSTFTIRLRS